MRRITPILCALALAAGTVPALAGSCPNPNALGTSRTLVIDNKSHLRLGSQQYSETLPLAPGEVVLTFDDGPLPPYTTRILDILKSECVKATYFLVGSMAKNYPDLVRRIHDEGHTVGTHSLRHPLPFERLSPEQAEQEISGGIAAVSAALGDPTELAPFFRFPGLGRTSVMENYLASRSLVSWSVDLVADDWFRHITPDEVMQRALQRVQARGRGILLLHDIHPGTVLALPGILQGLKARGFRIVHVVPANSSQVATSTEPQQWASNNKRDRTPAADSQVIAGIRPGTIVPRMESFGVNYTVGPRAITAFTSRAAAALANDLPEMNELWPRDDEDIVLAVLAPPGSDVEITDWPQTIRPANLLPAEKTVVWPVVHPSRVATRKITPRPAAATMACRNFELLALGLTPHCNNTTNNKPVGHEPSLAPNRPG